MPRPCPPKHGVARGRQGGELHGRVLNVKVGDEGAGEADRNPDIAGAMNDRQRSVGELHGRLTRGQPRRETNDTDDGRVSRDPHRCPPAHRMAQKDDGDVPVTRADRIQGPERVVHRGSHVIPASVGEQKRAHGHPIGTSSSFDPIGERPHPNNIEVVPARRAVAGDLAAMHDQDHGPGQFWFTNPKAGAAAAVEQARQRHHRTSHQGRVARLRMSAMHAKATTAVSETTETTPRGSNQLPTSSES